MQTLKYLTHICEEFGYEKTEELALRDPRVIEILIDFLLKNNIQNEAFSVFFRNKDKIANSSIINKFTKSKAEVYRLFDKYQRRILTPSSD